MSSSPPLPGAGYPTLRTMKAQITRARVEVRERRCEFREKKFKPIGSIFPDCRALFLFFVKNQWYEEIEFKAISPVDLDIEPCIKLSIFAFLMQR